MADGGGKIWNVSDSFTGKHSVREGAVLWHFMSSSDLSSAAFQKVKPLLRKFPEKVKQDRPAVRGQTVVSPGAQTQKVKVFSALTEDLGSVPTPTWGFTTVSPVSRLFIASYDLLGHQARMWCMYIHVDKNMMHKVFKKKKKAF